MREPLVIAVALDISVKAASKNNHRTALGLSWLSNPGRVDVLVNDALEQKFTISKMQMAVLIKALEAMQEASGQAISSDHLPSWLAGFVEAYSLQAASHLVGSDRPADAEQRETPEPIEKSSKTKSSPSSCVEPSCMPNFLSVGCVAAPTKHEGAGATTAFAPDAPA
jgi:hypothetical protein